MTADPFKPETSLLVKLGSLIVHAEEALSPHGHQFDRDAFAAGLTDPEVAAWMKEMHDMAFLPLKRPVPDPIEDVKRVLARSTKPTGRRVGGDPEEKR